MTDRNWIVAGFLASAIAVITISWQAYTAGHEEGVRTGRALGQADVTRRVSEARAACEDRAARTQAALQASCSRERETWHQNLSALTVDMEHYEEDLERCRHVRTR